MLHKLRKKIDAIDAIIIKKLEERFRLVQELEKHKDFITDQERESEILEKIESEHVREIYKEIFKNSKTMLKKIKKERLKNDPVT